MNTSLVVTPQEELASAVAILQETHGLSNADAASINALVEVHNSRPSKIASILEQGFSVPDVVEIYDAHRRVQDKPFNGGGYPVTLKSIVKFCDTFPDEPIDGSSLAQRILMVQEETGTKYPNIAMKAVCDAKRTNPTLLFEAAVDFVSGNFQPPSDDDPADQRFDAAEG